MRFLNRLLGFIRRGSGSEQHGLPARAVDFAGLERELQYSIRQQHYFSEALSHRSYLQISENTSLLSNERLEFLGDSVLNLVVAEFLFRTHNNAPEGDLTKLRSRLVNRKALSVFARSMNLGSFMLMSPGTAQMEGKGMDTILADAFEAVIGAVYLDGGFPAARRFVERHVELALRSGAVGIEDENFKSQLLEYAQSRGMGVPRYITVTQEGPDHDRTFTIEVVIGNTTHGKGVGKNKKDAEQAAAEQALQFFQESGKPNDA